MGGREGGREGRREGGNEYTRNMQMHRICFVHVSIMLAHLPTSSDYAWYT